MVLNMETLVSSNHPNARGRMLVLVLARARGSHWLSSPHCSASALMLVVPSAQGDLSESSSVISSLVLGQVRNWTCQLRGCENT